MKRKSLLRILAAGASGSLLASQLLAAQQDQSSPAQDKSGLGKDSQSQSGQSGQSGQGGLGSQTGSSTGAGESQLSSSSSKELRLSQVMGANVKSQQGETLGQINDFVVSPASGRIRFAIISLSSGPNSGKLTAVPWQVVRPSGANEFTLGVDKQKLDTAQTFDATSMPDFSPSWSRQVYAFYGVQPERMGGRIPTGESSTGSGSSKSSGSSGQQQPPGTLPRK